MSDLKKTDSANVSIKSTTSTLASIKSKAKSLGQKLKKKPSSKGHRPSKKTTQVEAMAHYLAMKS
ncbi:hypothetical protein MGK_06125 [Candida albicans P57055]|nr:hypothetical protein MGK_06125 [Candida albicans P57055]